jgi:ribosomal protein S18 acetylase RimI-like enzyme
MKIIYCDENKLMEDFLPIVIDLWCGDKYNPENNKHVEWIRHSIHARFIDFGVALCAYTDDNEPIGYIWYKHDTGLEGERFSGKNASIIQFGLYDQFQRQGIGTKLLDEACKSIKSNGGECLYTDTYAGNDDSMVFYIKRKFIPVALHPGEDGINDYGQVYLYKVL